ncbi:hypothetical protein [Oryzifoliimicrobium ureilyticus]|uniref:hypothetical protein n=1 Tax=Oryzifoliimicrobium ureilyticus TaxID=3113724 RepID=UPI00307659D8
MHMKLLAASLLAAGVASAAFAQSATTATGTGMDRGSAESNVNNGTTSGTSGTSGTSTKPMTMDSTTTGSTVGPCGGGNQAADSSGKSGSLQTQGGMSDASAQDKNCASHNN